MSLKRREFLKMGLEVSAYVAFFGMMDETKASKWTREQKIKAELYFDQREYKIARLKSEIASEDLFKRLDNKVRYPCYFLERTYNNNEQKNIEICSIYWKNEEDEAKIKEFLQKMYDVAEVMDNLFPSDLPFNLFIYNNMGFAPKSEYIATGVAGAGVGLGITAYLLKFQKLVHHIGGAALGFLAGLGFKEHENRKYYDGVWEEIINPQYMLIKDRINIVAGPESYIKYQLPRLNVLSSKKEEKTLHQIYLDITQRAVSEMKKVVKELKEKYKQMLSEEVNVKR